MRTLFHEKGLKFFGEPSMQVVVYGRFLKFYPTLHLDLVHPLRNDHSAVCRDEDDYVDHHRPTQLLHDVENIEPHVYGVTQVVLQLLYYSPPLLCGARQHL